MFLALLKSLLRKLVMLLAAVLILMTAYVSIGRHFMPGLSGYTADVEDWLSDSLGVPVTIDSLTGTFERFNPAIEINGLRFEALSVDTGFSTEQRGLQFEQARLVLDIGATLLQRRAVLHNFTVQGLDLGVRRTATGEWVLSGISLPGGATVDPAVFYDTIQRFDRLALSGVSIDLQLSDGRGARFDEIEAIIQNREGSHFVHLNATTAGSREDIALSVELTGNTLNNLGGVVHASFPPNDYSGIAAGAITRDIRLDELQGGGQAWVRLDQGRVRSAVIQPALTRLGVSRASGEPLLFEELAGLLEVSFDSRDNGWRVVANDLAFGWEETRWRPADGVVVYRPGSGVTVHAQTLDAGILRDIVLKSGYAPDALADRLTGHWPRGLLRNFALDYSLLETTAGDVFVVSNLDNVGVDTFGKTPGIWGISGYLEVDYDADRRSVNGLGEVDSENFSIHLASLFADSWSYDYVNGKLRFQVETRDGFQLALSSSLIVAESEIVDGRGQFSARYRVDPDGEIDSDLSLLVGALRVDGSKKSPYLPSASTINPGLYRTMEWLDGALLDGAIFNSGVIYRGPIHRGAPEQERTFQGFFNFNGAHVSYIEAWPQLSDVAGSVVVDNRNAGIRVASGQTMGLAIGPTVAAVERQPGGQLWLTVEGTASGSSQAGLDFLNVAPLEATLGGTMRNWQALGTVEAAVDLRIPLNVPDMPPRVIISADLQNNRVVLPDYQLEFDEVNGLINFDSVAGLRDSNLTASLFGGAASVDLLTQRDEAAGFETVVALTGTAGSEELAAWPGQGGFVRDILARAEGAFDYQAELRIERDSTRLTLSSDLQGLALELPQPFLKEADEPEPLNLQIDFARPVTRIDGVLGSELSLQIDVIGDDLDGIVYVGTVPGIADPWQSEIDAPGLELRGNLDVLNVSEWLDELSNSGVAASSSRDLTRWISRVRLDIGELDVFGQQLGSVNIQIEDLLGTDYWTVALSGQQVSGSVLLPFDPDEYIEAYLAYLRLPGNGDDEAVASAEADESAAVPVDVFASLDPRNFPRVKFFTGELSIGGNEFGLGRFTMTPGPDGARFSDLIIDFRGFRLGMADDEPAFLWSYDGRAHHSYLNGLILVDNIADVLRANGFAASLESSAARFDARLDWPGSPAFFQAGNLSGEVLLRIEEGRFLQGSGGPGALKLISIINLDAIMRRLRFSDDLLRRGLAYEEITGDLTLQRGVVTIRDQLVITGPSSVYQVSGSVDLARQTIDGRMYITLPLSSNIPWLGLLGAISGTLNPTLAIGAYLFERIFGEQVDSLTTAQYRLQGPWEGLQPELEQAFGTPPAANGAQAGATQGQ